MVSTEERQEEKKRVAEPGAEGKGKCAEISTIL